MRFECIGTTSVPCSPRLRSAGRRHRESCQTPRGSAGPPVKIQHAASAHVRHAASQNGDSAFGGFHRRTFRLMCCPPGVASRSRNSIDERLSIPAVFVVTPNTAVMPSADVTEASKRDGLREAVAISWRASETSGNWLRSFRPTLRSNSWLRTSGLSSFEVGRTQHFSGHSPMRFIVP